jgi:fumarate hydratase, class II
MTADTRVEHDSMGTLEVPAQALRGAQRQRAIENFPDYRPEDAAWVHSPSGNYFEALPCQNPAVELSGQLKVAAVTLMKIANDLRWMISGPLAGLGGIALPPLQPGSSSMPGKVNSVVAESVTMMAAQVICNGVTVTIAGQSGIFN